MAKHAILSIDFQSIQQPLNLKKLALLFDKLLIEEQSFGLAKTLITQAPTPGMNMENFRFNIQNIEFLAGAGMLAYETINKPVQVTIGSPEGAFMEAATTEWQQINLLLINLKSAHNQTNAFINLMNKIKQLPVSFARAISIRLKDEGVEAYPLFGQDPDYANAGKKERVLKFALSQIPQPDDTVAWEQIIDFKSDPNTMSKYYALIKWVNDVAKKDSTLNEIEDEYKSLYHDYAEQYRLNKIKSKQGVIEILITAAIDVLSGQLGVGMTRTSLFSLWKNNINLLESESKFAGKEVAYIYKANQIFK